MDKTKKRRIQILAASVFWLGVWQAAAAAIGQEVLSLIHISEPTRH